MQEKPNVVCGKCMKPLQEISRERKYHVHRGEWVETVILGCPDCDTVCNVTKDVGNGVDKNDIRRRSANG